MNAPLSEKQKRIVSYLREHGEIDFENVMRLIDDHYCNGNKHCSDTMSRMVKQGIVRRVRKGVFVLGTGNGKRNPLTELNQNQTELF